MLGSKTVEVTVPYYSRTRTNGQENPGDCRACWVITLGPEHRRSEGPEAQPFRHQTWTEFRIQRAAIVMWAWGSPEPALATLTSGAPSYSTLWWACPYSPRYISLRLTELDRIVKLCKHLYVGLPPMLQVLVLGIPPDPPHHQNPDKH